MKAKIKKGLTFFKPDGSKITVSTMDIKNQLVYYTQVGLDGINTGHVDSLPKKQFEAMISAGSEANPSLFKKILTVSVTNAVTPLTTLERQEQSKESFGSLPLEVQEALLKAKHAAKYLPDPSKASVNLIVHPDSGVEGSALLDLGTNNFKMLDGSKWHITSTLSQVVAINTETENTQTFTIDQFQSLLKDGHVVLI